MASPSKHFVACPRILQNTGRSVNSFQSFISSSTPNMRLPNAYTIAWHERSTFHSNTSSGESTQHIQIWSPLPFALKPTRSSPQQSTLLPEPLPKFMEELEPWHNSPEGKKQVEIFLSKWKTEVRTNGYLLSGHLGHHQTVHP